MKDLLKMSFMLEKKRNQLKTVGNFQNQNYEVKSRHAQPLGSLR